MRIARLVAKRPASGWDGILTKNPKFVSSGLKLVLELFSGVVRIRWQIPVPKTF
jgi:hypothetical protein